MNNRTQNASYHTQRPCSQCLCHASLALSLSCSWFTSKLAVTVHTLHSGWGNFTLLTDELELVPRCERTLFCTVKLKQLRKQTLIKTNLFWGKSEILSPADIVHWISKFVWFIDLTAFYQWLDFIQSPVWWIHFHVCIFGCRATTAAIVAHGFLSPPDFVLCLWRW